MESNEALHLFTILLHHGPGKILLSTACFEPTRSKLDISASPLCNICHCRPCTCVLQADRTVLGDILYWFRSKAGEEPTAKLVMWQATRDDKTWLSS
jgi:hypothetical protein